MVSMRRGVERVVSSQETEDRMGVPAKRFEGLLVWKKAHQFVLGVYRLTL